MHALWNAREHRQALHLLIPVMLRSSPDADEALIWKGLRFHSDGMLQDWDMPRCGLTALPEEFCMVRTTGDLNLFCNQLVSLPESFGSLAVDGDLDLSRNQLPSLPESFGVLTVAGDLT
eukprot:TRINITY_DN27295_c0_g1_i1.p2 TRINITY_DN27295_c0_g1~~TRINITY_DN27295_c0_g1_i1.p2  ORF type:complete len:119 (-),score=25.70 TRINITY_DN27295_c0_g1_i1:45-401(-)